MTLAINGGKPVSDKLIAYGKQYIDDDDINAVIKVLKGDYLTTGPDVKKFEDDLANYVGAKYAVTFSNGTAALHGACFAAGIGQGDEVITTALSFAASSNCVLYMGATPVFADIDLQTYNISPDDIRKKITSKTKAIIPVHYSGQAVNLDEIHKIAKEHDLIVIEDAAHAIGTMYKGEKIGALSDMTEFSFHPVKTITTGEGGAITTNSKELYIKLKMFASHGITRDKDLLLKKDLPGWYYEQQDLGYNYRMTDLQSALGSSQLKKIDTFILGRKNIVSKYNQAFAKLDEIVIQKCIKESDTSQHLYIIQLDLEKITCDRNDFYDALRAENIGVNVHYIPIYFHPYYQSLGYKKGLCPNAEYIYERIITLPLNPSMTDEDSDLVIEAVTKVLEYYRK